MKFRHKMMLLSLLALLVLPMFMIGPGGKPLMSLNDWMPGDVTVNSATKKLVKTWNKASGALEQSTGIDMTVKTPKLYKWKDAKGRWQFSNEPPPADAGEVFVQDMPQMSNVMQPVEMRERGDADGGHSGPGFKLAFPTSVSVKDIPKLVDDAKKLQKTAELRQSAL
ncbi:MAG: DUF4124 domain-containing protein, partial [Pseudomonadales bacterium]